MLCCYGCTRRPSAAATRRKCRSTSPTRSTRRAPATPVTEVELLVLVVLALLPVVVVILFAGYLTRTPSPRARRRDGTIRTERGSRAASGKPA
jgi:hypothetical protein